MVTIKLTIHCARPRVSVANAHSVISNPAWASSADHSSPGTFARTENPSLDRITASAISSGTLMNTATNSSFAPSRLRHR